MKNLISALLLLCLAGCSTSPSKSELDVEVTRLCAIDGGVKVYETVKLPPEKYNKLLDKFGRLWLPRRSEAKDSDEYYIESVQYYYHQGNPEMWRTEYRVMRAMDQKVLGVSVRYTRRGGEISGPWHESSYGCPDAAKQISVEKEIFSMGDRK